VVAIVERTLQPPLGEPSVHKEPDLRGVHEFLLGAKRRCIVTDDGHVADVALQRGVAGETLAPGFVRLEILEVLPAQIEHEVDRALLAGQALDKPQRLSSALLGLLLVDDAGNTVQYGRCERWGDRCFNHARNYTRLRPAAHDRM
jgi:hypothetical protein